MKRGFNTILTLSLLLTCSVAMAQEFKVVESSAKAQPLWINDLERGYITATASAASVDAAQQSALLGIKQQIAQSIASNISVELMQSTSSIETNSSSAYMARNEEVIRSTTEKIPFLQSIALSKASDFYWVKYYNKKSRESRFDYYIKYYFPSSELDRLVAAFNAEQAEINDTIKRMLYEVDTFTQIEDIEKNVSILKALLPKFAESDPRIAQISELINRYRNQYKNISLVELEHSNRRVVIQPMLNGRKVATSQIPLHKANCADRITKSIADGSIVVSYDDMVCRSGEDNWIELTFKFGVNFVKTQIHIIK